MDGGMRDHKISIWRLCMRMVLRRSEKHFLPDGAAIPAAFRMPGESPELEWIEPPTQLGMVRPYAWSRWCKKIKSWEMLNSFNDVERSCKVLRLASAGTGRRGLWCLVGCSPSQVAKWEGWLMPAHLGISVKVMSGSFTQYQSISDISARISKFSNNILHISKCLEATHFFPNVAGQRAGRFWRLHCRGHWTCHWCLTCLAPQHCPYIFTWKQHNGAITGSYWLLMLVVYQHLCTYSYTIHIYIYIQNDCVCICLLLLFVR